MIEEPKITREPSQYAVAGMIADALSETKDEQRKQIRNIVYVLGRTQALALSIEALDIDANGGMTIPDGSRRRTVGGIFFHLAYTKGVPKPGKSLIRPAYHAPKNNDGTTSPKSTEKPFLWADRLTIIEGLKEEKGQANVKIVLTGRPGRISERNGFIVTTMESTKVPTVAKGVPVPANVRTTYSVYIGGKQWKRVIEAIKDPNDILVIEGTPVIDAATSTIAVFASLVTTRNLQIAQKEAQKAKAAEQPATT